ncbi:MAG: DNA polymerase III subunit alpha [Propionibacteriaceae bacterium]|nr:DNA polymerase III subunit alpha [Propionibacteriaceae bacterium]
MLGFVHLHNHTDYSMLDGAARPEELIVAAATQGMSALAITDHGNMFGAYDFYKGCQKAGIRPIIGLEAYVTPGTSRFERIRVQWGDGGGDDVSSKGAYTHMTMWAETTEGMLNLFRLTSKASLEGVFYKPRIDRELLHRYHAGIIATTGCPSGEVATKLRVGRYDDALAAAAEFQDIFGRDNFFVELMDHGIPIEQRTRDDLLRVAHAIGAPLVATNDLHYVKSSDAQIHDDLLCVQAGALRSDTDRFHFEAQEFYLKSAAEMRALFIGREEACDNTLAIAERCQAQFVEEEGRYMPQPVLPEGETEESWLRHETEIGLIERFGSPLPDVVRERAEYELDVIVQKRYAGYFLVVSDYVRWAKTQGIGVGPGRGSGAGSLVAYAMSITEVDPLRFGLLFERFLNPERPSLPDFDIDFDDRRRGEVIDYVTHKYGTDHVAQIVTFGRIQSKQAVQDAARILGEPVSVGEKMSKEMPGGAQGVHITLADMVNSESKHYREAAPFRDLVSTSPNYQQVLDVAIGLEGLKRNWGVHAAGVIMSSAPFEDVIPIMRRDKDGAIITQFDYHSAEALGLVKMDFLGLRNLSMLSDTVENIRLNTGVEIDLDELMRDPSDAETYRLLREGNTLGIFQMDSDGIQTLMREMRADSFDDITAVLALYRPGPMGQDAHTTYAARKRGEQRVTPIHVEFVDSIGDILEPTYGLIVYQEQVMQIAQRVAGYSMGRADKLRKVMGKKDSVALEAEHEPFVAAMLERNFSREAIDALWEVLVPFASYAFNKSHSVAYAFISYWTAYLKAHYPVEFMAALLESVKGNRDRFTGYLNECRRMGIKVLPPDVNESEQRFAAVGGNIRFGLSAIKGVGEGVVADMLQARREKSQATSFYDFMEKAPASACNKRVVEALIKSGAFDSLGHNRRTLMSIFMEAVDSMTQTKRNEEFGQGDLFGGAASQGGKQYPEITVIDEWDRRTKLAFEREMLGLQISDHLLAGLDHVLANYRTHTIDQLSDLADGTKVSVCGQICNPPQRRQSKRGQLYAIIDLDDRHGQVSATVFPGVYEKDSEAVVQDNVVQLSGQVTHRGDIVEIRAKSVAALDLGSLEDRPFTIALRSTRCTPKVVGELKTILGRHVGASEVLLRLTDGAKATTLRLDESIRVHASDELMSELKALLGPGCVA